MHDRLWCEENILHTARSTPNTAFLHDAIGNVTNATDTSGNAWQFSYTHNSTLTNEVFTSLRLCDSARETNALARLTDAYSRPADYDLAINNTPRVPACATAMTQKVASPPSRRRTQRIAESKYPS